jgi:predicted O-methyltransferase YrrM
MKFEHIAANLKGIPYTQKARGKALYDHVIQVRPDRCLELGFAHGVATCYIAAALHEIGTGMITAVDLDYSVDREPNLESLLAQNGLEDYCQIYREKNSYTWFLKKEIERNSVDGICSPEYDFCFIDGPKNWTIDGLAFFLVDKLLNEHGWIVFDDFNWTYGNDVDRVMDGIVFRELSEDQATTPNIKIIVELLVMQHPSYSRFLLDEDWAWAQKSPGELKTVRYIASQSMKYRLLKKYRQLARSLRRF